MFEFLVTIILAIPIAIVALFIYLLRRTARDHRRIDKLETKLAVVSRQLQHFRNIVEGLDVTQDTELLSFDKAKRATAHASDELTASSSRVPDEVTSDDVKGNDVIGDAQVVSSPTPDAAAYQPQEHLPKPDSQKTFGRGVASARARPAQKETQQKTSPERTSPSWFSRLTGANTIARLGVVLLFIGLGFAVQLAARAGMFPLELRLALIALVGLIMVALGWRLRKRRPAYSFSLQGGGVAICYLVVLAALRTYQLIPESLAFTMLVSLTALTVTLAVMQDALALAVIGMLGGFATPLFVSSLFDDVSLFSYSLVLNIGVLLVAYVKRWRPLYTASFYSSFVLIALWNVINLPAATSFSAWPVVDGFLLAHFALYLTMSVLLAHQPKASPETTVVFVLPIAVFGWHVQLVDHLPFVPAISALGFAGVYLGLASWLLRRKPTENMQPQRLAEIFTVIGTIFVTCSIPLAFDSELTTALWLLEGAGLVWLGLRQKRRSLRILGVLLQCFAFVMIQTRISTDILYIFSDTSSVIDGVRLSLTTFPLDPDSLFIRALLAVSLLTSSLLLHKHRELIPRVEKHLSSFLLFLGMSSWTLFAWRVADTWVQPDSWLVSALLPAESVLAESRVAIRLLQSYLMLVFLAITAYLCIKGQQLANWRALGNVALGLLPSMVLVLRNHIDLNSTYLQLPTQVPTAWMLGIIIIWGATFALLAWVITNHQPAALAQVKGVFGEWRGWARAYSLISLWLLFFVGACMTVYLLATIPPLRAQPEWRSVLEIITTLVLSYLAIRPSMERHLDKLHLNANNIYTLMFPPVGFVLSGWLAFMSLNYAGEFPPLPYAPLLNPFDIVAIALVWLLGFYLWQLQRRQLIRQVRQLGLWLLVALSIAWLTTTLLRSLHHITGVAFRFEDLYASAVAQSSVSIFWATLALIAILLAKRWQRRTPWLMGMLLLAVVVVKLFLVDLTDVSTLGRAVSFASVGGLLLLIGYLVPLPPAAKSVAATDTSSDGT
ncbi:MAG: DUF2339 domain-containing protein [Deinococcota bacterium]